MRNAEMIVKPMSATWAILQVERLLRNQLQQHLLQAASAAQPGAEAPAEAHAARGTLVRTLLMMLIMVNQIQSIKDKFVRSRSC